MDPGRCLYGKLPFLKSACGMTLQHISHTNVSFHTKRKYYTVFNYVDQTVGFAVAKKSSSTNEV